LEPDCSGVIEVLSLCQSGVTEKATKPSQDSHYSNQCLDQTLWK